MKTNIRAGLIGLAVGDALGVPVEFKSREYLKENPVKDFIGYAVHNQPIGTWSDDSSLTFCLADSLCEGYDLENIATKFLQWRNEEIWTPHGNVFDIGIATNFAINKIAKGEQSTLCGGTSEVDNGNGSLMRILPISFYLKNEANIDVIYQIVKDVSSITHAHFRSTFSCFIYIIFTIELLNNENKFDAYKNTKNKVNKFISKNNFSITEIQLFNRILVGNINELSENEIYSSGYVLHSLEASLWCVLNSKSYKETVLKAVNLGGDTDTTACIAGGISGIYFGLENIPAEWKNKLVRYHDILFLADKLELLS